MAIKLSGSVLVAGSTTISETEFGYLDAVSAGTSSASKAMVPNSLGNVRMPDSDILGLGAGMDMQLYHDGTNSYIANKTGALKVATETADIAITLGHTSSEVTVADNLTVAGDLTVQGTTTTVNVEVVNTANGVVFEGSTDDGNEGTLSAVDPSAARTYQLMNVSGYVPLLAAASTAQVTATVAELNYLDIITLGTAAASKALTIAANSSWTVAGMTCADIGTVTTMDLNGGSIDGTVIGANSPLAGTFAAVAGTTANFSSTLNADGATTLAALTMDGAFVTTSTMSGSSTLRVKGASTFGPGNGTFLIDALGHLTSSGECHFKQGSGAGGVSIDANGLTSALAMSGSSTLRVKGASTFGSGNGTAVIAADGGLTIDHFDANWTNAGRTIADLGAVTTCDINGGAMDAVVIGANSAAAGTFAAVVATSLNVSDGNITNVGSIALDSVTADDGSSFSFGSNWTAASRTCADLGTVTTADINGGSVDGAIIGAASAALGKFTALSASAGIELAGALASGYSIDCNAGIGGIRADEFVTYSDRSLKTNIQKMDGALEKVMKLQPTTYEKVSTGKNEIGFIAQDVAKVVPEICALDATGEGRGIDYSRMSTLLVGALKAQQEQIAQLKEIVAKLQK